MPSRFRRSIRKPGFWMAIASGIGLSFLALTGLSGCGHKATAKGNGSQAVPETLGVVTTTPQVETIRRTIIQPGFIRSYEETPIFTKIPGFLQSVNVDIGDRVKQGQLLGELWVPEVKEDVNVKEARYLKGEEDVRQAEEAHKVAIANVETWTAKEKEAKKGMERVEDEVKRWRNELAVQKAQNDKGFLAKQQVDETENQLEAAIATLGEAKAKWAFAKAALTESEAKRDKAKADVQVSIEQRLVWKREWEEQKRWFEYSLIKAPYDGVVTRRFVHTGHFVQPSNSGSTSKNAEPLFVVMRTDLMRIVIQVPEYDAPLVKDGADAIVRVQALRNREIPGKVTRSSWSLDTEARTLRTEIWLPNPDKYGFPKEVFETLKKEKIPESVIAKLQPYLDQEFSKDDLIKTVAHALSPEEFNHYRDTIVKRATYQDLKPGMYVNVSLIADLPNAMTLPLDAILTDGTSNYIYTVEDGKATRVNVKVGVQNDRSIQLFYKQVPPAKPGEEPQWVNFTGKERVIISPLTSLKDGLEVAVK